MRKLIAAFAVVASLFGSALVRAELVTFTIDSSRSTLDTAGFLAGSVVKQQVTGSLTTSFTGTIMADVTPTSIHITGAWIDANLQPIKMQPDIDGEPGLNWADYGFYSNGFFGDPGYAAVRDLIMSVEGISVPLVGGSFDTTQISFEALSGYIDINSGLLMSWDDLTSQWANNEDPAGSLVTAGGVQTLTIPVSLNLEYSAMFPSDSVMFLNGPIVATRVVPEPAVVGMLCMGGAVALMRRRR